MNETRVHSLWPRLSVLQMMKVVVFAAVVSVCAAPVVRLAIAGVAPWPFVVMGEAVGIPLVMAIAAFPLVRRGPRKDQLIRGLLLLSTGAALGVVVHPLLFPSQIWNGTGATRGLMYGLAGFLSIPVAVLAISLRRNS